MSAQFIDNPTALRSFCESAARSDWLALDTEFVRERTYHARLCLVQVAAGDELACIDVLALDDLNPLADLLFTPGVVKVMHAAQQDLEILQRRWGQLPQPLFDTQIAAALLGQGEQLGYAALVKALLGVNLDKSQTRTDWSRRPLSEAQLRYAVDDVRYLGALYRQQRQALEARQRLDWLWAEGQALSSALDGLASADLWRRVKGHRNLRGVQLAVLQALAQWRDEQAEQRDLPRQWLVNDETLVNLARRSPQKLEQLQRLGLDQRLVRRDGQALLALIRQARELPTEQWPALKESGPLSEERQALLEKAQALVRDTAQRHGLAPTLIATRRDLEAWTGGGHIPALDGWRDGLVGEELRRLWAQSPAASTVATLLEPSG